MVATALSPFICGDLFWHAVRAINAFVLRNRDKGHGTGTDIFVPDGAAKHKANATNVICSLLQSGAGMVEFRVANEPGIVVGAPERWTRFALARKEVDMAGGENCHCQCELQNS